MKCLKCGGTVFVVEEVSRHEQLDLENANASDFFYNLNETLSNLNADSEVFVYCDTCGHLFNEDDLERREHETY